MENHNGERYTETTERCKHGHTVCVACTGEHGGTWVGKPRSYATDIIASEIGDAIAAHDSGETVNPMSRAKHVVAVLHTQPAPSPDVQLVKLLRELVAGEDDCSYDHHGYCQSHRLDPKPCPVERAHVLLAHIQRED